MARANYSADRQFLANVPGLQFTKPIGEMSNSYVHRLANSIRRQEGSGLPVSRQAARGHVVTPEHGPQGASPKLPAAAQEYRGGKLPKSKYARRTQPIKPPRVHKRPINVPEHQDFADKSVADVYRDEADVVRRLYEVGDDDRVVLSGFDCDLGIYRQIGVNAGHRRGQSARSIREQWEDEGGGAKISFEDYFMLVANSTNSDPKQNAEKIGHVCFWQVFVYPHDAHLKQVKLTPARRPR